MPVIGIYADGALFPKEVEIMQMWCLSEFRRERKPKPPCGL